MQLTVFEFQQMLYFCSFNRKNGHFIFHNENLAKKTNLPKKRTCQKKMSKKKNLPKATYSTQLNDCIYDHRTCSHLRENLH